MRKGKRLNLFAEFQGKMVVLDPTLGGPVANPLTVYILSPRVGP